MDGLSLILLRNLGVASKIPYMQDFFTKYSRQKVEVRQNRKNVGKSDRAKANAENTLSINLATLSTTEVQVLKCRYKQCKLARHRTICFKKPVLRNNLCILHAKLLQKPTKRILSTQYLVFIMKNSYAQQLQW